MCEKDCSPRFSIPQHGVVEKTLRSAKMVTLGLV